MFGLAPKFRTKKRAKNVDEIDVRMPEVPVLPGIQKDEKIINNSRTPVTGRGKNNASTPRKKISKSSNHHHNSGNSSSASSSNSRHLQNNVETKRMLNSFFSNLIVTPFTSQSQSVIVSSDNFSRFHWHDNNHKRQSFKRNAVFKIKINHKWGAFYLFIAEIFAT